MSAAEHADEKPDEVPVEHSAALEPTGGKPAEASEASPEEVIAECPNCKLRRDNYQALGLAIFFVSLFSCGTLTFIALPTGVALTFIGSRKCKECRAAAKGSEET
ncbi:MAG: hypothetical protein U0892_17305 [Pirellulales bacterium]